jgi:hypothetical protein
MKVLVCEQRKELAKLACDLKQRANIEGPLTDDQIQHFAAALQENQTHGYVIHKFCVKRQKVIEAIDEAGQLFQVEMDMRKESEESRDMSESIVLTFINFILQLVVGISTIIAERDS